MICKECGADSQRDLPHCEQCGGRLAVTCSYCGHVGSSGALFCGACGQRLPHAPPPETTQAGRGDFRHCTVLFADLVRSTELVAEMDPEEAMERLGYYLATMRNGIERFGGTVVKLLGDGIMAIFGAPTAHEGHAVLACEAAFELQRRLRALGRGVAARVGVHSGDLVFVPPSPHDPAPEAHGLTVHIASRLAALAEPGTIYLSAECARLAHDIVTTTSLGEQQLRGVPRPVEVFVLHHADPSTPAKPRPRVALRSFRGRESELATLQRGLLRLEHSNARVFGIVAPAGGGKSRLCHEFLDWSRARGISAFEVRILLYGHATPLQPILDLMRTVFFRIQPDDTAGRARQKVRSRLGNGPEAADDYALLCDVLGLNGSSHAHAEPRNRRARLLAIFRTLAAAIGTTTSVILIEDLHWLDEASQEFLQILIEALTGSRAMLVINYRPTYAATWMQRALFQLVSLGDLAVDDTMRLVTELIGPDPSVADLGVRIAERSGGNPFFIEELVRSLAESGALSGEPGCFIAGDGAFDLLPATVQAVVGARIDRLAPSEKTVLEFSTVIGQEVTTEILQSVTGLAAPAVERALGFLCEAGLMRAISTDQGGRYVFRHPLIQEVGYATQLRKRRNMRHAMVAEVLQLQYAGRPGEHSGLLAYHFEAAGNIVRAAEHGAQSAHWLGSTSTAQAIKSWHKVRALLAAEPPSPEVNPLRIMASSQIAWLGWREGLTAAEAAPFIEEALAWANETDHSMVPLLLFVEARIAGASGGPADAYAKRVKQALKLLRTEEHVGRAATLFTSLSQAYRWAGLLREALVANDAALARVARSELLDQQFLGYKVEHWAKSIRGRTLVRLGRFSEATLFFDEIRDIDPKTIDPTVQFIAHLGYAEIAWIHGEDDAARTHAETIAALAARHGSPYLRAFAAATGGLAHMLGQRYPQAAAAFGSALEQVRRASVAMEFEGEILASLAECHLAAGDLARARACALEARRVARSRSARLPECRALLTLAETTARLGGSAHLPEARRLLDRADRLIQRCGAVIYEPPLCQARERLGFTDPLCAAER